MYSYCNYTQKSSHTSNTVHKVKSFKFSQPKTSLILQGFIKTKWAFKKAVDMYSCTSLGTLKLNLRKKQTTPLHSSVTAGQFDSLSHDEKITCHSLVPSTME